MFKKEIPKQLRQKLEELRLGYTIDNPQHIRVSFDNLPALVDEVQRIRKEDKAPLGIYLDLFYKEVVIFADEKAKEE